MVHEQAETIYTKQYDELEREYFEQYLEEQGIDEEEYEEKDGDIDELWDKFYGSSLYEEFLEENRLHMRTKRIKFREYVYILHEYYAEVDISLDDFEELEAKRIGIEEIKYTYDGINYDDGESLDYGSYIESYEYDGEVK